MIKYKVKKTVQKEIPPMMEQKISEIRAEIEAKVKELEKQMRQAAKEFDFERAAELRDIILEIKSNL